MRGAFGAASAQADDVANEDTHEAGGRILLPGHILTRMARRGKTESFDKRALDGLGDLLADADKGRIGADANLRQQYGWQPSWTDSKRSEITFYHPIPGSEVEMKLPPGLEVGSWTGSAERSDLNSVYPKHPLQFPGSPYNLDVGFGSKADAPSSGATYLQDVKRSPFGRSEERDYIMPTRLTATGNREEALRAITDHEATHGVVARQSDPKLQREANEQLPDHIRQLLRRISLHDLSPGSSPASLRNTIGFSPNFRQADAIARSFERSAKNNPSDGIAQDMAKASRADARAAARAEAYMLDPGEVAARDSSRIGQLPPDSLDHTKRGMDLVRSLYDEPYLAGGGSRFNNLDLIPEGDSRIFPTTEDVLKALQPRRRRGRE